MNRWRLISNIARMTLGVATLLVLSACSQTGEWDEEVRLSNGEIVKVHRTQHWTTTHPAGEGVNYIGKKATFDIESTKSDAPNAAWNGSDENLMVLDIDIHNKEYFLISTPTQCWKWDEMGRPTPPYVEYRFRDHVWRRVPWSGIATGRRPNLWMIPVPAGLKAKISEDDIAWQVRLPKPLNVVVEDGRMPGC